HHPLPSSPTRRSSDLPSDRFDRQFLDAARLPDERTRARRIGVVHLLADVEGVRADDALPFGAVPRRIVRLDRGEVALRAPPHLLDRKSTRLNSSHQII